MAYTLEGRIQEIEDKVHIIEDHLHAVQQIYPSLAAGVTLTAGGTWVLGNLVEIIPKNYVDDMFDIHWINTGAMSNVTSCEIHLFKGDVGQETVIAKCGVDRLSNQSGAMSIPILTPLLDTGTRVSAKLASAQSGTTLVVKLSYHKY